MNIKIYLINIYLLLPIALLAEDVNFKIKQTGEKNNINYEITITLPQNTFVKDNNEPLKLTGLMESFVSLQEKPGEKTIIINSTTIDYAILEIEKYKSAKPAWEKLDTYIRTNIINSMVFDPNNYINLTVDLYSLTTFNKAYRELYNAIRDFSKDLTQKSPINRFKRFFGLEESPEISEGDILPDLAPKAYFLKRAYQAHPKITTAVGVPAALTVSGYALWKLGQQQFATTPTISTTPTPSLKPQTP